MGLCVVGLVGVVGSFVWWVCGSSGPVDLVGHGSGCGPVGLVVGLWVWWVLWVFIDKSPTFRGQTCQSVLGLVFHRFPGISIRLHYRVFPVSGFFS